MNIVWQNFHFLRPDWFFALLPLALMYLLIKKWQAKNSGWQRVIPTHLYTHLIGTDTGKGKKPPYRLLALGWLMAVVALAGPTWERLPQPVFQLKTGHVVVMDMSLSMRATDLTPDRLARAKYKAIDLINAIDEGEMGLVAYAGDAFVISPLTSDSSNLTALLPSLSPEIMPVSGSDPLLGIEAAVTLLENAGYQSGQIYWITDGVELSQVQELQEYFSSIAFNVSILGVGTEQGAPIRQLDGELLKHPSGSIVIPKMRADALQTLSEAGNGRYASITANERDIQYLSSQSKLNAQTTEDDEEESRSGDQWAEVGPYLVLALLPFAAYAFRRGVVFICLLSFSGLLVPREGLAQETPAPESSSDSWWQAPFLNSDQEGYRAFTEKDYDSAAREFSDPSWQGAAHYKAGNYEAALEAYSRRNTPQALYNQGNALAHLGELDAAIARYDEALAKNPDFADARANKELLEELKKQQEQQNKENQQQQSQSSDQQQNDSQQQEGSPQDNQTGENSQQQSGEQSQQAQDQSGQRQDGDPQDRQEGGDKKGDMGEEQERDASREQADKRQQRGNEQGKDATVQMSERELSDAEKEQQQRLENLKRRIPDDPAYLLKRKMQLEAQQRRQQRLPADRREEW